MGKAAHIVCYREADIHPADRLLVPAARRGACAGCRAVVLMAPSTAAMVARGEVVPVCGACLPPGTYTPVRTAEQERELRLWRDQARNN
jgi:hypothetical protein